MLEDWKGKTGRRIGTFKEEEVEEEQEKDEEICTKFGIGKLLHFADTFYVWLKLDNTILYMKTYVSFCTCLKYGF